MPRCSSGDCGATAWECVPRRNHRKVWSQVYGVAAPRLNLPGPQRQLMAKGLGAPKGASWFLKAIPCMGFCLSHVRSMATPWDTAWAIAISHCLLYIMGRKKSFILWKVNERGDESRGNSSWPYAPAVLSCLLYRKSHVKHKAGVVLLQMEGCGVVRHCQTQRESWRTLQLRKTVSSSLDIVEVQDTSLKSFSWHTEHNRFQCSMSRSCCSGPGDTLWSCCGSTEPTWRFRETAQRSKSCLV